MYFCAQRLKHTESDKLKVQIQAYLDNLFDVGTLLEDAETKNAALERVEELEENLSHVNEYTDTTVFFLSFLELIPCSFSLIFRIVYWRVPMQKPLKAILVKNLKTTLSKCCPHIVCLSSTFTSNTLNPNLNTFRRTSTYIETYT